MSSGPMRDMCLHTYINAWTDRHNSAIPKHQRHIQLSLRLSQKPNRPIIIRQEQTSNKFLITGQTKTINLNEQDRNKANNPSNKIRNNFQTKAIILNPLNKDNKRHQHLIKETRIP